MVLRGETEVLVENPDPLPLCPAHNSHGPGPMATGSTSKAKYYIKMNFLPQSKHPTFLP